MFSDIRRSLRGALLAAMIGVGWATSPASAASMDYYMIEESKTVAIWFTGEIAKGDYERIKRTIDGIPAGYQKILLLESGGGDGQEGMLIGRYIRQTKIPTMVPLGSGCHSACTFIFLAGTDPQSGAAQRILVSGAKLGFHQGRYALPGGQYSEADLNAIQTATQNMVGDFEAYLRDINASPEFLRLYMSAPSSDMTLITEFQALRLGIHVMDVSSDRVISPEEYAKR